MKSNFAVMAIIFLCSWGAFATDHESELKNLQKVTADLNAVGQQIELDADASTRNFMEGLNELTQLFTEMESQGLATRVAQGFSSMARFLDQSEEGFSNKAEQRLEGLHESGKGFGLTYGNLETWVVLAARGLVLTKGLSTAEQSEFLKIVNNPRVWDLATRWFRKNSPLIDEQVKTVEGGVSSDVRAIQERVDGSLRSALSAMAPNAYGSLLGGLLYYIAFHDPQQALIASMTGLIPFATMSGYLSYRRLHRDLVKLDAARVAQREGRTRWLQGVAEGYASATGRVVPWERLQKTLAETSDAVSAAAACMTSLL